MTATRSIHQLLREPRAWLATMNLSPQRLLLVAALVSTAGSTLAVYPHQLAYFNELAGGLENGHRHLLGSNLDWGQDLLYVSEQLAEQSHHASIYLLYYGASSPSALGIRNVVTPDITPRASSARSFPAGLYVLSANYVGGDRYPPPQTGQRRQWIAADSYTPFGGMSPVGRAGGSILMYEVVQGD